MRLKSNKQHITDKRLHRLNLPHYYGRKWVPVPLPKQPRDWADGGDKSVFVDGSSRKSLVNRMADLNRAKAWVWPKRRVLFFSDLHGDPDAFAASLVASGGVQKTGPEPMAFKLTAEGRKATFIIGGDCFDKGPSSLGLLRAIRHLIMLGARVRILAGNHDVRVLFGMMAVAKEKNVHSEHFFIRTGQKIIPLLAEVWAEHQATGGTLKGIPTEKTCRKRLFPRTTWIKDFQAAARGDINPAQVRREVTRIQKKLDRFEDRCHKAGLNIRQVYAACEKWKSMFLTKDGEFYWFYKNMRLVHRAGSFLFVHAGIDDQIASTLLSDGAGELNRAFRRAVKEPPVGFYYGPICNCIRTKYRDVDLPLTKSGTEKMRRNGIAAVIHGHRNLHQGQRLAFRKSLINFECDTSLDRHTRKAEKIRGRGASVTVIDPKGYILGVSSDYPHIKVFDPKQTLEHLSRSLGTGTAQARKKRYKSARRK